MCDTTMHADRAMYGNSTNGGMQTTQLPRQIDVATVIYPFIYCHFDILSVAFYEPLDLFFSSIFSQIVKSHHTCNYAISYSVVLIRSATGQADNEYCLPLPPLDYRCCSQEFVELSKGNAR